MTKKKTKKKKVISKQQKSLQSKVYYLRRKNKGLIENLNRFDPNTFYNIRSKKVTEIFKNFKFKQLEKVKGSTLLNIIRNNIKNNNTVYDKTFKTLKNKFKKDLKNKKEKKKNNVDLIVSVPYQAWELNQAIAWAEKHVNKNDVKLARYLLLINEKSLLMGNYDQMQMTYNKKLDLFDVFIINNGD